MRAFRITAIDGKSSYDGHRWHYGPVLLERVFCCKGNLAVEEITLTSKGESEVYQPIYIQKYSAYNSPSKGESEENTLRNPLPRIVLSTKVNHQVIILIQ